MSNEQSFIYVGQLVHAVSPVDLDYVEDGVLVIVKGVIAAFERTSSSLSALQSLFKISDDYVYRLNDTQFLMPGLIDTHIHGPQWPNVGLGYSLPLLNWLKEYTYPLEVKFSDPQFATKVYNSVVKRTLEAGTTTACYFATIHSDTALILANSARQHNQRAFIGKVNMNVVKFGTPDLTETLEKTIQETENFLAQFPVSDIVKPIITPRFALSCDMVAMQRLAQIASKNNVHIQTHISENQDEIKAVHDVYPESKSYADVYDTAGLLTSKTVLAHGVYLADDELRLIRERGSAVSHCPNSNISLQSGLCPVRRLLNAGIKVGLGTDCSGGYSVSMLDAMRHALNTSICVAFRDPQLPRLTLPEVFYMATLGGAGALALDDLTGSFSVGKQFDALVIDLKLNAAFDLLDSYDLPQLVQKLIYLGDDRNIAKVYVAGQLSVEK